MSRGEEKRREGQRREENDREGQRRDEKRRAEKRIGGWEGSRRVEEGRDEGKTKRKSKEVEWKKRRERRGYNRIEEHGTMY